jgi:hypothetical protein
MKTNLLVSLALSAVILGCGNSNFSVNSNTESSESLAKNATVAIASGCTQSPALKTWEALPQATKDYKITNLAFCECGGSNSGQCYGFVRDVISMATNQGVVFPMYDKTNMKVLILDLCMPIYGRSTMVENCIPGDIIQMYWNCPKRGGGYELTQHTAIFLNGNVAVPNRPGVMGMAWVDCNYVGTNLIGTHIVAYSDFYSYTKPTTANPKLGYNVYHVQ